MVQDGKEEKNARIAEIESKIEAQMRELEGQADSGGEEPGLKARNLVRRMRVEREKRRQRKRAKQETDKMKRQEEEALASMAREEEEMHEKEKKQNLREALKKEIEKRHEEHESLMKRTLKPMIRPKELPLHERLTIRHHLKLAKEEQEKIAKMEERKKMKTLKPSIEELENHMKLYAENVRTYSGKEVHAMKVVKQMVTRPEASPKKRHVVLKKQLQLNIDDIYQGSMQEANELHLHLHKFLQLRKKRK